MFFFTNPTEADDIDALNRAEASNSRRAVSNLGSLLVTRLDLLKSMRSHVLGGVDMNLGKAQILIELYGAKELPQWSPRADDDGYVALRRLRDELVHDTGLLARSIGELEKDGMIEVWSARKADGPMKAGVHVNGKALRITEKGASLAGQIWRRYWTMANELLRDVSDEDLAAHLRVNEAIRRNCRAPMFEEPPMDALSVGVPKNVSKKDVQRRKGKSKKAKAKNV